MILIALAEVALYILVTVGSTIVELTSECLCHEIVTTGGCFIYVCKQSIRVGPSIVGVTLNCVGCIRLILDYLLHKTLLLG